MSTEFKVHIAECATFNGYRWCNCSRWPWECPNCEQVNSYWAEQCGRCNRYKDTLCRKAS